MLPDLILWDKEQKMEELKSRFLKAVEYVRFQRKIRVDIGLAISNAAKQFEVDQTELAREMAKLATEAKAERIKAREDARKARLARWQKTDDSRYKWMND